MKSKLQTTESAERKLSKKEREEREGGADLKDPKVTNCSITSFYDVLHLQHRAGRGICAEISSVMTQDVFKSYT